MVANKLVSKSKSEASNSKIRPPVIVGGKDRELIAAEEAVKNFTDIDAEIREFISLNFDFFVAYEELANRYNAAAGSATDKIRALPDSSVNIGPFRKITSVTRRVDASHLPREVLEVPGLIKTIDNKLLAEIAEANPAYRDEIRSAPYIETAGTKVYGPKPFAPLPK
jgi:hypothetical protein